MVTPSFSGSGTGQLMAPLILGERKCQKSRRFGKAHEKFGHGHVPIGQASRHVQLATVFF